MTIKSEFRVIWFSILSCTGVFIDIMFSEDQDDVPFFYDDSFRLQDGPRDWTLPSVSICAFCVIILNSISRVLIGV